MNSILNGASMGRIDQWRNHWINMDKRRRASLMFVIVDDGWKHVPHKTILNRSFLHFVSVWRFPVSP